MKTFKMFLEALSPKTKERFENILKDALNHAFSGDDWFVTKRAVINSIFDVTANGPKYVNNQYRAVTFKIIELIIAPEERATGVPASEEQYIIKMIVDGNHVQGWGIAYTDTYPIELPAREILLDGARLAAWAQNEVATIIPDFIRNVSIS